jgi:prevent-host-death family protein
MEQAAARVEELVERAERGEPVIITRDGQDAAALRPIEAAERLPTLSLEERRQLFKELQQRVAQTPDLFQRKRQREARTFFMTKTAYPSDRGRHLGADGDPQDRGCSR